MKRLIEEQIWDYHKIINYIYFTDDFKLIGSYTLNIDDGWYKIEAFYIQLEYRGKGYMKKFVKDIFKNYPDEDLYVVVHKGFTLWEKYGFEYYDEYEQDDRYEWWNKLKK